MIENVILLKKVDKPSGKNYLTITYDDKGEEHSKNVFPAVPGYNLLAPNKMVKLSIDKNDKGYWTIVKVEEAPVNAPQEPQQPIQPIKGIQQPHAQPPVNNAQKGYALRFAVDLCAAGMLAYADIYNCASDFEKYMDGSFKPVYKSGWDLKT